MLPIIIGSSISVVFSLLVASVYGPEAFAQQPWVGLVIWGVLITSALVSFVGGGQSAADRSDVRCCH